MAKLRQFILIFIPLLILYFVLHLHSQGRDDARKLVRIMAKNIKDAGPPEITVFCQDTQNGEKKELIQPTNVAFFSEFFFFNLYKYAKESDIDSKLLVESSQAVVLFKNEDVLYEFIFPNRTDADAILIVQSPYEKHALKLSKSGKKKIVHDLCKHM